jgi:hypothetical protein
MPHEEAAAARTWWQSERVSPFATAGGAPSESSLCQDPNFGGSPGACDLPVMRRRHCICFEWSGSDFAEEPAFRM